mgnify:CR=1 FL=1
MAVATPMTPRATPRVGKAPPRRTSAPTKLELLVAQIQSNPNQEETTDLYDALAGRAGSHGIETGGSVTSTAVRKIAMWKPLENGKYSRRLVPSTNLVLLLGYGWLGFCPDCGADCGEGKNDCPERAPVLYRRCPVCGMKVYDPGEFAGESRTGVELESDPLEIKLPESHKVSTPEERTLNLFRDHMIAFHQSEARSYTLLIGPVELDRFRDSDRGRVLPSVIPASTMHEAN